ncbi:unnamed protein product [Paramecium octaurelia]|uniref:Uncharacterized protein n=1 Tax=Paramecium octaurelia TaxID=43137 RepID=A0A8S1YP03_PAROT|nr:unnamed protein product [Paramecium octaurelia]CAD8215497.1 unnamed protein product [Paramecium octaurelia]
MKCQMGVKKNQVQNEELMIGLRKVEDLLGPQSC